MTLYDYSCLIDRSTKVKFILNCPRFSETEQIFFTLAGLLHVKIHVLIMRTHNPKGHIILKASFFTLAGLLSVKP